MTKPPAFQFYVQDFMTGTRTLTLAERGAYITLLCHQWDKGDVPGDDPSALRKILGCTLSTARSIWDRIAHKFPTDARGLRKNKRMERERAKQRRFRKSQSNKGKASAARRNRGSTAVQPMPVAARLNPSSSSSSSSSSSDLQSTEVPTSTPSVALAPPSDLWIQITDRLDLRPNNRKEWFEPCTIHALTDAVLEINTWGRTRASWLHEHFRRRIEQECADLLAGRRLTFVVKPLATRAG